MPRVNRDEIKQMGVLLHEKVENEIKMLLHAGRDCMRNQGRDTKKQSWDVNNPYYCEAFGVLRGLVLLGYGYFGANNIPGQPFPEANLKWWFDELQDQVLEEEGFNDGTHQCDHCFEKYFKDCTRKRAIGSKLQKQEA